MSNRRASSGGGVEDPLAPQAGPSQPTAARHKPGLPSKRKAPDEENEAGTSKRSKITAPANKSKILKGEKKAGGLIINPILPPSNAPPASSSNITTAPPARPPSAQGSSQPRRKPPEKLNITKGDVSTVQDSVKPKGKGKGKERELVAPTRQDLEADEDVRRMDEERERLRVRDAQTHSKSVDFKEPILPKKKSSAPRRRQTGFAFGAPPDTPEQVVSVDSTQPIPVRDTPTIDRNRAMRGEPVKRRSSMSMRGKRASSSFENTGVIPQPHPSVSTSNFHKHIDQELPEAHRARHLLVWCTARTSTPPGRSRPATSPRVNDPPAPPLTAEGVNLLHEVQKEMQKMLTEQRIEITLSSRMDDDTDKTKVKEHEQNAKNRIREDDFMRHIERCKQEDAAWSTAIQAYNARQASVVDTLARQRPSSSRSEEWIPPDPSDPLHDRELLGAQLARKCKETASRKRGQSPLAMRMAEVENKADRVHSTVHISDQLTKRTTRNLDKRFEALARALAARSQPPVQPGEVSTLANLVSANPDPPSATGLGGPPDTLSILRALARTDVQHPQREMGDAARRVAREVQRMNATTPGRSSVGGIGAADRRLTAVAVPTPRKAPGTPHRGGTPRQKSEAAEGSGG